MAEQPGSGPQLSRIEFPEDPELPDLANHLRRGSIGCGGPTAEASRRERQRSAEQIRVRQFGHNLSRIATASYDVQWPEEEYLPPRGTWWPAGHGGPTGRVLRVPRGHEPSRALKASGPSPQGRRVGSTSHVPCVRRGAVCLCEVVRYRPRQGRCLRHNVGKVRPSRGSCGHGVPQWLATWELVARSAFSSPRLAGCWEEGGVVWNGGDTGRNMRQGA